MSDHYDHSEPGDRPAQRGRAAEMRVAELFRQAGYSVAAEETMGGVRVDLLVEKDGLRTPIGLIGVGHIKPIDLSTLRAEADRLRAIRQMGVATGVPVLIAFGSMSTAARHWAGNQKQVAVWDLQFLEDRALSLANLNGLMANHLNPGGQSPPASASENRRRQEGLKLIDELERHGEGKLILTPLEYEQLCMRTFAHLFDPKLYGFQRQVATTDGGNRYDFICRIKPGHLFWDSLRADFRTKAVLFECKNYGAPISADQVYSTERYLFAGALRTVCFLVARKGGDASSLRAAQGTMRENGKLILVLSNLDLVEMIKLDGEEDGPENFLDERIWKFIVTLSR